MLKSLKNRVVTKKSFARPSELAWPIKNASVDILKLLEANSTFARLEPISLDRVEWPSRWSCSASISNASLFYAWASLARPSFGRVGLECLVSLTWVIKALITWAFGVKWVFYVPNVLGLWSVLTNITWKAQKHQNTQQSVKFQIKQAYLCKIPT